jgi:hypothetical protein
MRIHSADRHSWLSIEPGGSGNPTWVLAASVRTGLGELFSGSNADVFLEHFGDFATAFDSFVGNRAIKVRVEGTYGTWISVWGNAQHVILEFHIGAMDHLSRDYAVRGAFELDQEQLASIAAELRELRA